MTEQFVFDVFDEDPLELEGAEVLVGFPPVSEGVVRLEVTCHLGDCTELARLDD